jgi:Subtilisin inhibitor-like
VVSLAALALAVLLTGCGDAEDDDARTVPEDQPASSLTVTLDRGEGGETEQWELTCEPAGGTHPNPDAACAALDDVDPEVLNPVPPDSACTMIYGGPQTATLSGTWRGEPIDAAFSREHGCEIARWDAMVDVLTEPGGVTS